AEHLDETIETASNFWQNLQFDLVLSAAVVVVVWALIRPRDLANGKPYWWASLGLLLLALCPLLVLGDTLVRPLAKSQYVGRSAAGLVVAAMVVFIWAYASDLRAKLPAFLVLTQGDAARRFMAFAMLMLVATLPSDVYLTRNWTLYLDTVREAVRGHPGVIAF